MRTLRKAIRISAIMGSAALLLGAPPAAADHDWLGLKWKKTGKELSIPVIDRTTGIWRERTAEAVLDWNASTAIDSPLTVVPDSGCTSRLFEITACNGDYGANGWLGIASVSVSDGYVVRGRATMNDYYFNSSYYNTYSWRQLVMCQEIGHTYGLAHQNENFGTDLTTSCMEYTSRPDGNESPDAHDFEMLAEKYGGSKGGGGKGKPSRAAVAATLPAPNAKIEELGRVVGRLPNGVANVFEKRVGDVTIYTHVTWTVEYMQGGGDHRH